MKRFFSAILAVLTVFACLCSFAVVPVSAENPTTVYISDTGADTNDGLTAATPVKTWDKVGDLLNNGLNKDTVASWTIIIVGASTYDTANNYNFLNIGSSTVGGWLKKSITVQGNDGAARFILTRSSVKVASIWSSVTFKQVAFFGNYSKIEQADETRFHWNVIGENTVYVSDNGNDSNNGLTAATPVKTWTKAGTLQTVSADEWNYVVVGTSTYAQSEGYNFMNLSSISTTRPVVITGSSASSVFNFTRSSMVAKQSLTFKNIVFKGDQTKIAMGSGCTGTVTFPSAMFLAGAQLAAGTTASSASTAIRFIGVIDSLDNYSEAGILLSVSNKTPEIGGANVTQYSTTTVYDSVNADGNTLNAAAGTYFVALALTDIPQTSFGTEITVRGYAVTAEGDTVYTDVATVSVNGLLK